MGYTTLFKPHDTYLSCFVLTYLIYIYFPLSVFSKNCKQTQTDVQSIFQLITNETMKFTLQNMISDG